MNSATTKTLLYLVPFGLIIYLLDKLFAPKYGMGATSGISAGLVLILLGIYVAVSAKESDERERMIRLQADSAALYVVTAGLLAATIFYPHSQYAMVFWAVVGLAVTARVVAFIYRRYK